MLFNSYQYLIFLPLVVVLYYAFPYRLRNLLLLFASYYFYMCWKAEYAVLIGLSTVTIYYAAKFIANSQSLLSKKIWLASSLVVNLGILFFFKYFNFFNESFKSVFNQLEISYSVEAIDYLLPVGISFYTFQSLSYAIDVYRGNKMPEQSLIRFALYVSFFPQLVAGPIERSTRLLPQFLLRHNFDYDKAVNGLRLIMWGFFKKMVIADRLAPLVEPIYAEPGKFDGGTLLVSTYAFTFQIFCDFSAYSDIAIGSALILGFSLMNNFDRPYFAVSLPDFWKRWHISLTSWFRDYLYVSLGGNRVSKARWYVNILIVFLVSGLWHGANWTFVAWGAVHGGLVILSRLTMPVREKLAKLSGLSRLPRFHKFMRILITFHLVVFAWVFFRAKDISQAFLILKKIALSAVDLLTFSIPWETLYNFSWISTRLKPEDLRLAFTFVLAMEMVHFLQREKSIESFVSNKPLLLRWGIYCVMIWVTVIFGIYGNNPTEFVYFQF